MVAHMGKRKRQIHSYYQVEILIEISEFFIYFFSLQLINISIYIYFVSETN